MKHRNMVIEKQGLKRDETLDVARALSVLWIVGILHLTTYIDTSAYSKMEWTVIFKGMYASLATFTFLSGYFLKNKSFGKDGDSYRFYMGRLKRFWIPFFIACTSLYIIGAVVGKPWFESPQNFVLSLCGLSIFFLPLPGTLWYMVMLLFFYILTPAIMRYRTRFWGGEYLL